MRRADRLFRIVQYLRGGRLVTATQMSQWLEVSERTIYRDVAELQKCGVPVDGEAGVGYVMRSGFELPPLMFTREEMVALVAGARLIQAWGGAAMARGAVEALVKIDAVLPSSERQLTEQVQVHAFAHEISDDIRERIDRLEAAVENKQMLTISYTDADGQKSTRVIRPLGLWFWGKVWTHVGWCELRNDFRMFRVDRIEHLEEGEVFSTERGKSLSDFYRQMNDCE